MNSYPTTTILPTIVETSELNTGALNSVMKHLILAFLCVSLALMVRLLLYARLRPSALRYSELSPTLLLYLWFHVCGALLSIPYDAYAVFEYYAGKNKEHSASRLYTLYWLGIWQNTYNALSPLVVLFLTAERCITIKCAGNPAKCAKIHRTLLGAGVITVLLALAASTIVYLAELPLDTHKLQELGCETVSCLMLRLGNGPQLVFKCAVGFVNICSCAYFLRLLRTIKASKHIKNLFIIVTMFFEVCLSIAPAFVSLGFFLFGSGPLSNVISFGATLDSCCCAIYYSIVFLPKNGNMATNSNSNNINNSIRPVSNMLRDNTTNNVAAPQLRRVHSAQQLHNINNHRASYPNTLNQNQNKKDQQNQNNRRVSTPNNNQNKLNLDNNFNQNWNNHRASYPNTLIQTNNNQQNQNNRRVSTPNNNQNKIALGNNNKNNEQNWINQRACIPNNTNSCCRYKNTKVARIDVQQQQHEDQDGCRKSSVLTLGVVD